MIVSPVKTKIKCETWVADQFTPKINFLYPGIKSGLAQSGLRTNQTTHNANSKHMKNIPKKIREIRQLLAHAEHIEEDHTHDGVDRRGFLKCMAWAGTGMLWTVSGGVLGSKILSPMSAMAAEKTAGDFSFVQISDSHIGFNKPANADVVGTLKK